MMGCTLEGFRDAEIEVIDNRKTRWNALNLKPYDEVVMTEKESKIFDKMHEERGKLFEDEEAGEDWEMMDCLGFQHCNFCYNGNRAMYRKDWALVWTMKDI
jgi:hypothetical protein